MIKFLATTKVKFSGMVAVMALCQACTLTVPVDDPSASTSAYIPGQNQEPTSLKFQSKLPEGHNPSESKLPIKLSNNGKDLVPDQFLATHLQKEFNARGLPLKFSDQGEGQFVLEDFQVISHRVSGFSPMVTLSMAEATFTTDQGSYRIQSLVKRAKLPMWTMDEINEPCYNEPLELLVKELTAKINKDLYGYSMSDEVVDALVTKLDGIAGTDRLAYMDVYELGFSNNPKAIEPLVKFTKHDDDDYVRLAAISSLGILGADNQLDYLKSIYQDAKMWQDRAMALKAIGDLGSQEAVSFLKQQKGTWASGSSDEATWNRKIIELYL